MTIIVLNSNILWTDFSERNSNIHLNPALIILFSILIN